MPADGHHSASDPDEPEGWSGALAYWREYPAEQLDDGLKHDVRACVGRISSTIPEWRAAIRGNAAAAVKLALDIRMPAEVTASLDLVMTVLLAAALEDAGAASVMAHVLRRAPLDPVDRTGLSTSWLVHNIWCESRIRNAGRKAERGDPA